MRVFIAEKEAQAAAIASALVTSPERGHLHLVCGDDIVTWAAGHLYKLPDPEHYDPRLKEWKHESLPIIPQAFELVPIEETRPLLNTIAKFARIATVIINACDPDREGQRIADEILERIAGIESKPVLRLDTSGGLSPDQIRVALRKMVPNEEWQPLGVSAHARAIGDWLIGMNGTRKLSLAAREAGYPRNQIMSIGRVQTPTLALIAQRDLEIESFVSKPYWSLCILASHRRGRFPATWMPPETYAAVDDEGRIVERELAERVGQQVVKTRGSVASYTVTPVATKPPLPLNTAALSMIANEEFGLTASEVDQAAEFLYVRARVISYPRTDCRHLASSDHADAHRVLLAIARANPAMAPAIAAADVTLKSEAFDDSRLRAHKAIVPLDNAPRFEALSETQQRVYMIIARAYIAQFYPDTRSEKTEAIMQFGEHAFRSIQTKSLTLGWRELYRNQPTDRKYEIPDMKPGDGVVAEEIEILTRETTPPRRYTDSSIISEMVNAARHVDDQKLKKLLSDCGIGTAATRSTIIETLIKHGLVTRQKRYLVSTTAGRDLVRDLPTDIKSPMLSAMFEHILGRIAVRQTTIEAFVEKQQLAVRSLMDELWISPNAKGSNDSGGGGRRSSSFRRAS